MLSKIKDIIQGKASLSSPSRSSKWPKVRKKHLEKNPCCALCGATSKLNVHHIKPYHLFPELELEESNLITLCENKKKGINCHLFIGHLGNYKNINPCSVQDAATWNSKLKN
jgi:hypothetical protein